MNRGRLGRERELQLILTTLSLSMLRPHIALRVQSVFPGYEMSQKKTRMRNVGSAVHTFVLESYLSSRSTL